MLVVLVVPLLLLLTLLKVFAGAMPTGTEMPQQVLVHLVASQLVHRQAHVLRKQHLLQQ